MYCSFNIKFKFIKYDMILSEYIFNLIGLFDILYSSSFFILYNIIIIYIYFNLKFSFFKTNLIFVII